jgi:Phage tail tube protein
MSCAVNKIDSNITGMSIAVEQCLQVLPSDPVWLALEPNTYSDFGGKPKAVSRAPIVPYRQNLAGTLVDVDANAGFNTDVTKSNLKTLLQGFFFASARENPTNNPMNGSPVAITAVVASSHTYDIASGGAAYIEGMIVNMTGFEIAANNGLKTVASSTATTIVVNETVANETVSGYAPVAEVVGVQFTSGDLTLTVSSSVATLATTTFDMTTIPNLFPGKWIFIGGDSTSNTFASNVGYARILSIAAHAIVLDQSSFTPVTDTGSGKTIRIYSGMALKNEYSPSLIVRRSYTIERTLGIGAFDAEQAEYVTGAVADKLTLNMKSASKMDADLTYMGCGVAFKDGNTGNGILSTAEGATIIAAPGEDAINTSSNIYEIKMSVNGTATCPTPLFGFISDMTFEINNSVTGVKAVGVFGSMDTSTGNFVATGNVTAYFANVAAQQAIYANASVDLYAIVAYENTGVILDMPLLKLDGGQATVEKDKPITMKLTANGAMNANQYTLLYQFFSYLPTIAMAA